MISYKLVDAVIYECKTQTRNQKRENDKDDDNLFRFHVQTSSFCLKYN